MSYSRLLKAALPFSGMMVLAAQAHAAQWPVFDHIKLTPTGIPATITVESENDSTWTKVRLQKIPLAAKVDIKMKKGEVTSYRIAHGGKDVLPAGGEFVDIKHLKTEVSFESSTANLGIASIIAVQACNAKLKTGAEIYSTQYANISTDLSLHVRADTNKHDLYRDNFGSFPLVVKCVGIPIEVKPPKPQKPPVADIDDLKPGKKLKVRSAKLVVHKPPSNVCPAKGALTAQFETNFDGKVTFIYRQAGGGKSKPITVASKKLGNGKFMAVHSQPVPVTKAVDTKYMIEVVGKGIISEWEAFKAPCKIGLAGGDELANPPAIAFKVLSAQLGIKGPKSKVCPNKATLMAWFKTSKPGNVGFRLMRKDGPVGPMIFVPSVKAASGYMATYSRTIPITKPMNMAYSAVVPGAGGLASAFVPLKASCGIGLPGGVVGN